MCRLAISCTRCFVASLISGLSCNARDAVEERLQSRREVFYDWLQRLSRYEAAFAAIGGDPAPDEKGNLPNVRAITTIDEA